MEPAGSTKKVIISFIDTHYRNVKANVEALSLQQVEAKEQLELAEKIVAIASSHGLVVERCGSQIHLQHLGINPACCIDGRLFEQLLGCSLKQKLGKSQYL